MVEREFTLIQPVSPKARRGGREWSQINSRKLALDSRLFALKKVLSTI